MHLSQWVSKTNPGCFLEGFRDIQTDVPSLCIILRSRCLSLPREVPFVPGDLCPCQKKKKKRASGSVCPILCHPGEQGPCRCLEELGPDLSSTRDRAIDAEEPLPVSGSDYRGSSFPRCCLWRGSACPGRRFCLRCPLGAIDYSDVRLSLSLQGVSWYLVRTSLLSLLLTAKFSL